MCLVAIATDAHPSWPLLVLGNRDEFHARPTAAAEWWRDADGILGGRDLEAGGSWLAVRRDGHFAVVTNLPQKPPPRTGCPSRGLLVRDYLLAGESPARFAARLDTQRSEYAGFCLAFGGPGEVRLVCEPGPGATRLAPGLHVFSNAPAGQRWPKIEYLEQALERLLAEELADPRRLLEPLERRAPLPTADPALPWVALSPFIAAPDYGTRAVTLFAVDSTGQCRFVERRFGAGGEFTDESEFRFALEVSG